MKKITSFEINHLDLLPGVYVSRLDPVGDQWVTTLDIRMKAPNREPVINNGELHAMEHLGATFLRNHPAHSEDILYFGPMGCRTGFYLLLKGDWSSRKALPLVTELFKFMADFDEEVPGAAARDCGNYLDMNLPMAKYEAKKFYTEVLTQIKDENLEYPE